MEIDCYMTGTLDIAYIIVVVKYEVELWTFD